MSLTPEERAIVVMGIHTKDGARFGHLEMLITDAIREAENEKLEEAARLMDRVMADSKAALIRTLKHED